MCTISSFGNSKSCETKRWTASLATLSFLTLSLSTFSSTLAAEKTKAPTVVTRRVIGPTAIVEEAESDITFRARVDTGATTTSLHAEEWAIQDEAKEMAENIGKTIRFKIKNARGETEWLQRKIAEISLIKTSEDQEQRYKVRMDLKFRDINKKVLVSLNDRSHMTYPVLLGRNFLQDDFVVDVALGNNQGGQLVRVEKQILPGQNQPEAKRSKQDADNLEAKPKK